MPETRSACSAGACELLSWDSEFWGFPIGRIQGHTLASADLVDIDGWCQERSLACLYFLATSDDPATVRAAENGGFRLVDTRVTLGRAAARLTTAGRPNDLAGLAIRPSVASDIDALRRIAAQSHRDTRFFFDLHFPRAKCEMLYERWIAESCAGYADQVLVAEHEAGPAGYVTCHLPTSDEPVGRIGLVGVSPEARGRGAGRGLVLHALDWFARHEVEMVTVATQGRNIGAQALYQRCGFVTRSQQLWYHKWFCRADVETA